MNTMEESPDDDRSSEAYKKQILTRPCLFAWMELTFEDLTDLEQV